MLQVAVRRASQLAEKVETGRLRGERINPDNNPGLRASEQQGLNTPQ